MQMASHISNVSFYLPFTYVMLARMGTPAKSLGLLLIYAVPTCYYFLLAGGFDWSLVPIYLLCITLIYTLYEMGYIQNDTETIKREENPSIWLWPSNFEFYETHKYSIYATRLGLAAGLSVLFCLYWGTHVGTCLFLCMAWSIALIYQIYNRIRNRWNLLLFAMLQICRYLSYLFLFAPDVNGKIVLLSFVSFPLCYIVERTSHPRYHLKWIQQLIPSRERLTSFRVKYYAALCLVCSVLLWQNILNLTDCVIPFYFLVYRSGILLYVKRFGKPRNYLVR